MIFLDAFACYLSAWLGAFSPEGRRLAPLSGRRLIFLALFPIAAILLLLHAAGLLLDRILYPDFRRIRINEPVFILGIPRSGTTFLHRELARDESFASVPMWRLLFAPAICQRRLLSLLQRLDAAFGAPMARGLAWVLASASKDVQSVHETELSAAEEDYLALLPAAGCFFASLAFPQAASLALLGRLQEMPAKRRQRLLDHYHRLLQRFTYDEPDCQYLAKNAAFASWLPYLADRYPNAHFVLCIREPRRALSSQVSSLHGATRIFAALESRADLEGLFAAYYSDWLQTLQRYTERCARPPLIVEQELLRADCTAAIAAVYAEIGRAAPQRVPGKHSHAASSSEHRHNLDASALPPALLDTMIASYEALRGASAAAAREAG